MSEGEILRLMHGQLPLSLGCGPKWLTVWDVKLGPGGGRADMVVVSDEPSIVIVEAKLHANAGLKDAVVGQIMLYYVTALTAEPRQILDGLRRAARGMKRNAKRGLDAIMREAAVEEAEVLGWIGSALAQARDGASSVRAVVVTDEWNEKRDMRRLGKIVRFLRERGISLDVAQVDGGAISWPLRKG